MTNNIPTVEEAGVIAAKIFENLTPNEQAFAIAGFQEAIKYLRIKRNETK